MARQLVEAYAVTILVVVISCWVSKIAGVTRDTSHDPTHGLVRPRGRRRLLEAEQACSSLTRSPLLSVVCCALVCFSWHLGVLGGATGRMWP